MTPALHRDYIQEPVCRGTIFPFSALNRLISWSQSGAFGLSPATSSISCARCGGHLLANFRTVGRMRYWDSHHGGIQTREHLKTLNMLPLPSVHLQIVMSSFRPSNLGHFYRNNQTRNNYFTRPPIFFIIQSTEQPFSKSLQDIPAQ